MWPGPCTIGKGQSIGVLPTPFYFFCSTLWGWRNTYWSQVAMGEEDGSGALLGPSFPLSSHHLQPSCLPKETACSSLQPQLHPHYSQREKTGRELARGALPELGQEIFITLCRKFSFCQSSQDLEREGERGKQTKSTKIM